MIKSGLIAGTITLIIVLGISYFTGNWSYVYYLSGTLGLAFVALALANLIDSLILGNKGSFSSEKETRKIGRREDAKRFISLAVPNLLAALVYIIN
ncbi:DUF5316 domain-containing protein [Priestia megaterium]|uniref:DUF5316 domain-containing protein n=1 Tax=Priestia megaterium TaxID=1404 RepID=UPI00203A67D0|nr:DUF5316 domain-containing protein [Priestia megaterium]MCM3543593.1 DUF5316 domain-containing protein [Priestia megaterium]MEC1071861.1 DUF5316 domain-containing protein [Priestia megaterium]